MLSRPEHAGAFRLKELSDAFFEPLASSLSDEDYLLGTDGPSSMDYLAFGYLSLMLYPQMPQNWLSEIMPSRYAKLARFVDRMSSRLALNVSDKEIDSLFETSERPAMVEKESTGLPWQRVTGSGIEEAISFITQDMLRKVPSWLRTEPVLTRKQDGVLPYFPILLATASTCAAIAGYWMHQNGLWPHGDAVQIFGRKRLADFGAAGAALAVLGGQRKAEGVYQQAHTEVSPVEVDVVVDG